ncbi:MAG: ATP-binding protein [Candidatus Saccharimonas sp.]|nr:MAG: ATP-binding protein [Candidatus Saccharimonas sp.]
MRIFLSNQAHLRNFSRFIKSIDFSNPDSLEVETHKKWITVHPAILAFTAALAIKTGKENSSIELPLPDNGKHLDSMGLFNFLKTESPFRYNKKESSGRYIPLQVVKTADDQSKFIAEMVPLLHLPEKESRIIKYIIGELVRNVLEHSLSDKGAVVAANYYPKKNKISIGICDTGIGIWKSMNEYWRPKDDISAIRLSLMPGITGTTHKEGGTRDNAGAGLFFTKSIARITRSYFTIFSGKAEYTLLKGDKRNNIFKLKIDPFDDPHRYTIIEGDFKGTLVAIDMSLDNTPEFQAILKLISSVYDDAIRDRKRTKYKEPKFL